MIELTDEIKLSLIDGLRETMERQRIKNKGKEYTREELENQPEKRISFYANEFSEGDRVWITEMYGHYGVNVSFDL